MSREHVLIIAEAGVNHNGSVEIAHNLIDAAANAGADYVKFQTFSADRLVTLTAPKAEYQEKYTSEHESQFMMLEKLALDIQDHKSLLSHCSDRSIGFLSTGFDIQSLDSLFELKLDRFKIPSGELTNLPYLRHIASFSKPLIVSTGMASFEEIDSALVALEDSGVKKNQITLLHCNTAYPTPMTDVNLRVLKSMKKKFDVAVGYSDHTMGIEVPIAATALGATVIEKHITLDRRLDGPDHQSSIEPEEFSNMVRCIRNIEEALGERIKKATSSEKRNIPIVRKSLVAAVAIQKGEYFTSENMTAKRPGTGISPMRWDEFIGKVAIRNYEPDELLEL
jgi:N,N'-diacetyllegionaminate synthase